MNSQPKNSDLFSDPGKKRSYNKDLFSIVAPRYDLITKLLSFGQDRYWKKELIELLEFKDNVNCVDLACGTGDLTFLLSKKYPNSKILGIDLTNDMIKLAKNRNIYKNVEFQCQDMCDIKIDDNQVDIVTGGYALRNAPNLKILFKEIHRILKPNGVAAFLEFSKPNNYILQKIQYFILRIWGSFWGLIMHGRPWVYAYISESLKYYPNHSKLHEMIKKMDFEVIYSKKYFFSIIEIFLLKKI